jgi:hypothetical protein
MACRADEVLQCGMAIHPGIEQADTRLEIVESVRPRLSDLSADDVERLIEEALDELTPANVTTFLPILVERRVRDRVQHRDQPPG